MQTLTLTRPDDWHIHLRDGDVLRDTVPAVAERFGRALIMPNLKPPVITTEDALQYRQRILQHLPSHLEFEPVMTLYLTAKTTPADIVTAKQSGVIKAVKYYPMGATTHSDWGVHQLSQVLPVLEAILEQELVLCIHGEVTDPEVDIFDREKVFIDRELLPLITRFPNLKIVLEHITTAEAVKFIQSASNNIAATITAHHLLYNRNHMLVGGIRPDYYCLPILKRQLHQTALLQAATSGNPKFFLGTDSAPHAVPTKHTACGCAGCYTAHAAIELYAEAFEQVNALDKLEGFASFYGADFYGMPRNKDKINLIKQSWLVPNTLPLGDHQVTPLRAGETISWKLAGIAL